MANRTCWIDGCSGAVSWWSMCENHHQLWLEIFPRRRSRVHGASIPDRFFSYVTKSVPRVVQEKFGAQEDCWIWTGALDDSGYGIMGIGGRARRTHLVSLEVHGISIASSLQRDHRCRFRPCCNPNHLDQVTQKVNVLRGRNPAALNAVKTTCPHGHALAGDNLLVEVVRGKGGEQREKRRCRECTYSAAAERHAAKKSDEDRRRSDETCRKGHPRTQETTVIRGGKRRCRICLAEAAKAAYERKTPEQKEARRVATEPVTGVRGSGQFRKERTHCPQGHPYAGENLMIVDRPAADGSLRQARRCRTCQRAANLASAAKRRSSQ